MLKQGNKEKPLNKEHLEKWVLHQSVRKLKIFNITNQFHYQVMINRKNKMM